MSLTKSYELRTSIPSAAAMDRFVDGIQISSGRPVRIHLLAGGYSAENQKLLSDIDTLPPKYRVCFLETGNYEDSVFVVTDALSDTTPFRKWFAMVQSTVRSALPQNEVDDMHVRAWQIPVSVSPVGSLEPVHVSASPAAPIPSQVPAQSPAPQPGEFTRMFAPPVQERNVEPVIPVPTAPATGPGEFTSLFQIPAPQPSADTAQILSGHSPETRPTASAGEFTQLFQTSAVQEQAPLEAKSLPRPVIAKPAAGPGEFTQLFKAAEIPSEKPASLGVPPPTSPPLAGAGEFTQLFQAVAPSPVATPVAPPVPAVNSDATLIFQVPSQTPARVIADKAAVPPSTPGEFTRMFAPPVTKPVSSLPELATPRQASHSAGLFDNDSAGLADFPQSPERPRDNSQPGEFTRMMESPLARAGLKPAPFSPAASPVEKVGQDSGFTRMMESSADAKRPTPAPPPKSAQPSGDATRAFQFREPVQPAAPAPEAKGPSEFTNMFKAPLKEPVRAEVKPVKPARIVPRRKKKPSYLKWILIASVILLIVVLIIYFVF